MKRSAEILSSAPERHLAGTRESTPNRRLVVLVSGEGSNLQALMDAIASGGLGAGIVLVVSSNPAARALERAAAAGIPTLVRPYARDGSLDPEASRAAYDGRLAEDIIAFRPDFIFLLGWMRILGEAFVSRFPGKIVNLHPALPGAFPGVDAIARAWRASREGGAQEGGAGERGEGESGVMTHFVPDAGVDSGPPIEVEHVKIRPGWTLAEFEAEMHSVEHRLVVKTLIRLLAADLSKKENDMPTALFSVYDKEGLVDFAAALTRLGWKLLASGGTSKALKEASLEVEEISTYTGAPEILDGRVKTLHPAVHGGILARDGGGDLAEIAALGYRPIDLVVVDLYPFEKTVADPASTRDQIIEKIDIGGVALIRAAAKNHGRVAVVCGKEDYGAVAGELRLSGGVSEATRRRLAAKAFGRTAAYDASIASWFARETGEASRPESLALEGFKVRNLRYGENPHQKAELYSFEKGSGPLGGRFLQGKELSYNNILDLDAAWQAAGRFGNPAVVVVKHLSPCGIAEVRRAEVRRAKVRRDEIGDETNGVTCPLTLAEALLAAVACDPISAYGGVIACSSTFDGSCAKALGSLFVECIAAPSFDEEALALLSSRKNLRLVVPGTGLQTSEVRTVLGGFLRQDVDSGDPEGTVWKTVSRRQPSAAELDELAFAWKACMSAKSNAIVLAKGGATVGIGSGQPNRVDSVRIAANKAGGKAKGSVLASDAFFPFPDSIVEAAKAGVTAIAHPGGSIRDEESLKAADEAGMAMVITGVRHFRH